MEERGYYRDGQLSGFGERVFGNGNSYVGELTEGRFEGQGLLINPGEKRWVYGRFKGGKLNSIADSGDRREGGKVYRSEGQCLRKLHQLNREAWIDLDS